MCYCCQKLENLNIFNGINGIGLKCIENRPQMYRESASNVQNSVSEPIRELYIWGRFVHLRPNSIHWRPDNLCCHVICLSQSQSCICAFENWPQMYGIGLKCTESASNVQIGLKYTYIWGRSDSTAPLPGKGVQLAVKSARLARERCGRVRSASNVCTKICLKCMYKNWPQMYRESASNVQRIGLKCTEIDFSKAYR